MIKARKLDDLANSFEPEPLTEETFAKYYCETISIRMNDKYESPLQEIFDECIQPKTLNAHLLLGHKGCGKSTELNHLKRDLEKAGHKVAVISCALETDMLNLAYGDLLVLIGESLLKIANEVPVIIDSAVLEGIQDFWKETEVISENVKAKETTMGVGVASSFLGLLNIFASLKREMKYSDQNRTIIREEIQKKISKWIYYLNVISGTISHYFGGKQPIIIFEDLDKMDMEATWKVFGHNVSTLSQMPFPLIYTFPIGLSYDGRFANLKGYFHYHILPMIKIRTENGDPYSDGINIIKKIVFKRAEEKLFEPHALELLIEKTGGSLRELFRLIISSARRATRRKAERIELEDAQRSVIEEKSWLTRLVEKKDYPVLTSISNCKAFEFRLEARGQRLEVNTCEITNYKNTPGIYYFPV